MKKQDARAGMAFGLRAVAVLLIGWLSHLQLGAQKADPVDVEFTFQEGNRLMLDKQMDPALARYRQVLAQQETAALHHNLGIAYYQSGDTGRAVLHLERALRQGFGSAATREILSVVRQSEGIAPPRYTILQRLARSLPEGLWMVLVFVSFWSSLVLGVYFYLLVKRQSLYRDVAILSALVFGFSCVACVGLAQDQHHGVLLGNPVGLKVVPTTESEAFLTLKSGEMARYLKRNNQFVFVETSDGVRGWVPESQFLRIRERSIGSPASPGDAQF